MEGIWPGSNDYKLWKKVLDISSGCKSSFGNIDVEEMQEEVIVCLFLCLIFKTYYLHFWEVM